MDCDLHLHSTASDGTVAPGHLPLLARRIGLGAIALTDHDTTAGLVECAQACHTVGIAFVPGIEISTDAAAVRNNIQGRTGTLHVLGLFVRHDDERLLEIHRQLLAARNQRNPQIVANLQRLGVKIDHEEVMAAAQGQVVGRPHIARVLMEKGYVKSIQDAFARYIGEGAAAYVRKDHLPPAQAIDAIHHAGGLAIMAHPVQLRCRDDDELEHVVSLLADLGLDGLEIRHSEHTAADCRKLEKLAERFDLLSSGGSDFHGSAKSIELGAVKVPLEMYHHLHDAWRTRSANPTCP